VFVAYEIPVTQARAEFAELLNRVVYGGERVVLTRHGKPLVALVPAADLDRLEGVSEPTGDRQSQIVRLGSEVSSSGAAASPSPRRLDIAAERRLPGDGRRG
jgi:prevent-host-death family protein